MVGTVGEFAGAPSAHNMEERRARRDVLNSRQILFLILLHLSTSAAMTSCYGMADLEKIKYPGGPTMNAFLIRLTEIMDDMAGQERWVKSRWTLFVFLEHRNLRCSIGLFTGTCTAAHEHLRSLGD